MFNQNYIKTRGCHIASPYFSATVPLATAGLGKYMLNKVFIFNSVSDTSHIRQLSWTKFYTVCCILQGCDCAANWLILSNSYLNFVIPEISVNQVRKCYPAWGVGVFTIHEQPCKCYNCRRFLCILGRRASLIPDSTRQHVF